MHIFKYPVKSTTIYVAGNKRKVKLSTCKLILDTVMLIPLYSVSVKCRLQNADCRPGTKCRLRTKCRLQTGYKTQTKSKNCFLGGL